MLQLPRPWPLKPTTLLYPFVVTVLFGCTHTDVGVLGESRPTPISMRPYAIHSTAWRDNLSTTSSRPQPVKPATPQGSLSSKTEAERLLPADGSPKNAEKTIDIQYFIYSTDHVGLIASDFILRAAKRGVKVRLLVDDLLIEDDGIFLRRWRVIRILRSRYTTLTSTSVNLFPTNSLTRPAISEVSTNGCITRHSSLMVK